MGGGGTGGECQVGRATKRQGAPPRRFTACPHPVVRRMDAAVCAWDSTECISWRRRALLERPVVVSGVLLCVYVALPRRGAAPPPGRPAGPGGVATRSRRRLVSLTTLLSMILLRSCLLLRRRRRRQEFERSPPRDVSDIDAIALSKLAQAVPKDLVEAL